jgi:hypothetical protein
MSSKMGVSMSDLRKSLALGGHGGTLKRTQKAGLPRVTNDSIGESQFLGQAPRVR